MMDDFLTSRQVQDILKVDRITVYRMLQDGRIKGIKLGQQWRFARREVERLVGGGAAEPAPEQIETSPGIPTHCVQTIQDLFSDLSGLGALLVDQQGEALTQISHACGFCQIVLASRSGLEACRASWQAFARDSSGGRKHFTCHAGLQYIGTPITENGKQVGLFLAGQCHLTAPDPGGETDRVRRLAASHHLQPDKLLQAASAVFIIDPDRRARVEAFPALAARAIESILHERSGFIERLQQIANLTQIP
ncbi:MAG: PocR ligand-binding domain-containing protein [Anaerolineaceae bacterium]|nr:PocR ligand-binding domain-containing protein [Anaerolineaceae bacterium]